ncbi:TRIC cation channel family protein, partial [Campylobacter jejuni]
MEINALTITTLYIIGISAEGMTGALAAGRHKMDLFGVIFIALVTAIGGGSIRD